MKKGLRAVLAAAVVFVAAVLAGCSDYNVFSVDSLLKPPKLTGENTELQKVFEADVGANASLVRPVSGDYRSAYVLYDYDGDGTNEAIVFYTPKDTTGEARIHFLKYDSDKETWNSVADLKGNGTSVYSVSFCNFDNDGTKEIAVVWQFSDGNKEKSLAVYRHCEPSANDSNGFKSIATVRITDYFAYDINSDDSEELIYTFIDPAEENPAVLLKCAKFSVETELFESVSEVNLDNRISGFMSYAHDVQDEGYVFYFDAQIGDGKYITDIVYFDNEKSAFVRPVDERGVPLSEKTVTSQYTKSEDVDGDGIVEIARQKILDNSYSISEEGGTKDAIYRTEYFHFTGLSFKSMGSYYVCDDLRLRIKIDSYSEYADIIYDVYNGQIKFIEKKENADEEDDLLFRVYLSSDDSRHSSGTSPVRVSVTDLGKTHELDFDTIKQDIDYFGDQNETE